jgi:hypothetical protein
MSTGTTLGASTGDAYRNRLNLIGAGIGYLFSGGDAANVSATSSAAMLDYDHNCINDPRCVGHWVEWTNFMREFSEFQDPEGIQDMFNFGDGESIYVVDPNAWNMDEFIDVGTQMEDSINTIAGVDGAENDGRMRAYYLLAAANPGVPIPFSFYDIAMNMNPFSAALTTEAWPFGRVVGNASGTITADGNGNYETEGILNFQSDQYDWDLDGNGFIHDYGIGLMGNNSNGPNRGDMYYQNLLSQFIITHDGGISGSAIGGNMPDGNVPWHQGQSVHVIYPGDFYFQSHGSVEY